MRSRGGLRAVAAPRGRRREDEVGEERVALDPHRAQEAAAFEREVSEEASKRYDKPANGILVPNEVLKRDLNVGTATAGGNLVPTELLAGSFIDILRKRMAVMATNPTMLTGLLGMEAVLCGAKDHRLTRDQNVHKHRSRQDIPWGFFILTHVL